MNVPNHFYRTLKQFGDKVVLGAPVKFQGWLATDITDKNGVEVFEGDKVKINGTFAGTVYFREGVFRAGAFLLKDYSDGEIEVVGHSTEEQS